MLQYHFNWKVLSAAAGITWWNFYFRLYQHTIRAAEVVNFLGHLSGQVAQQRCWWSGMARKPIDRLVSELVARQRGRIELEYPPAYAPELNPVEYIWGYWKHHELPNFCPDDFSQLSYHAPHALRRMRRRPTLVMAFWEQADLFLYSYIMQTSIVGDRGVHSNETAKIAPDLGWTCSCATAAPQRQPEDVLPRGAEGGADIVVMVHSDYQYDPTQLLPLAVDRRAPLSENLRPDE